MASFTPRGSHKVPPGVSSMPILPECCVSKERRCAANTFLYQVQDPPWFTCPPDCPRFRKPLIRKSKFSHDLVYDNVMEYTDPKHEDLVMPTMAFWHYCDHVPDLDPTMSGSAFRRSRMNTRERSLGPWPPFRQNECPPSKDCEPCGPGPWANPQLRRFFYMDCQ